MPKPTFMQAVLGKPSRSYADPYAPSPWADEPEREYAPPSSRYTSRVDQGVHLGFRDDYSYDTAGPSQPSARRTRSTVSAAREQPYIPTRFPKAAKKAQSVVALREMAVEDGMGGDEYPRPASSLGTGTVKRKKKKKVESVRDDAGSSVSGMPQGRPPSARRGEGAGQEDSSAFSIRASSRTERYREPSNSSSSATSSSLRPHTPAHELSQLSDTQPARPKVSAIQRTVPGGSAPLTPPASEPSSSRSSRERLFNDVPHPKESVQISRSDTVRTSRTIRQPVKEHQSSDQPIPAVPAIVEPEPMVTPPITSEPPTFNIQPPTPAAFPDGPDDTPFHAGQPPVLGEAYSPLSAASKRPTLAVDTSPVANDHEQDAQSDSGVFGSDDEEGSGQTNDNLFAPGSAPSSRPPSVIQSVSTIPSSSHSRQSFRNSPVRPDSSSRRGSEVSFGARSGREGSIKSSASGFGKGGWAVAAAASQSGRNTPVQMFLPTNANSGWGDFQVPPPRQSKFTPLPAAYQPPTFDRLVRGERSPYGSGAGSVRFSLNGREEVPGDRGLPSQNGSGSAYSQESESESEDDLPRPSRSYAQQIREEYIRQNGIHNEGEQTESRRYSTGPYIPPKDPRRNSTSTPRSDFTAQFPSNGLQRGALSRSSHSEVNLEDPDSGSEYGETSRPPSVMSRPMSPTPSMRERETFPRPAFLDPDLLTLLPEMTVEDSERLYRPPSPSEREELNRRKSWKGTGRAMSALGRLNDSNTDVQSVRRAASVIGFNASRSEADLSVGRKSEGKRAKSVVGFRSENWEASSHGDGVLMQSDGRGQESSGYNTMVLPAGAYVPSDPNRKRTSIIDPRVLGLPHTTMATLCLSHSAHRLPMTPLHLRGNLPPPVDFTSHIKPPTKVGNKEILVQVYAVAVDELDVMSVEEKGKGEVGKWVPGRSFVGRCLGVGGEEKEIVRGEIVVGLLDIRKSGALAEYIVCDRRRISRAPHPTSLSLEQLALLPLYGIPATRAVRGRLNRGSRALIMDPHEGVAALICQEMSRAGVNVTALIGGGEAHHDTQTKCLQHGARGVLTGSAAAVMLGLDEDAWDVVVDTKATQRVYDAARRMLKDGGKLISLTEPDPSLPATVQASAKPSGLKTLRAAFASRRKTSKFIHFEYIPPAGSGEPEVDAGGLDVRDVLEEPCMTSFVPTMGEVWAFERGMEAFRGMEKGKQAGVVRIIN